jgi:hypothetical protein
MIIPLVILSVLLLLTIGGTITFAILMHYKVKDLEQKDVVHVEDQAKLNSSLTDLNVSHDLSVQKMLEIEEKALNNTETIGSLDTLVDGIEETLRSNASSLSELGANITTMVSDVNTSVSSKIDNTASLIVEQEEYINEISKRLYDREMTARSRQVCIDDICLTSGQVKGIIARADPNDIRKRADLMAIAIYNALRDPRVRDNLEVKLMRHMMITGFLGSQTLKDIYDDGVLAPTLLSQIGTVKKYYNGEIIIWLEAFMTTYKPKKDNPNNLSIIDLEREKGNGLLDPRSSLATTFGNLNPSGLFFPPTSSEVPSDAPRGDASLFDIYTETMEARALLDALVSEK